MLHGFASKRTRDNQAVMSVVGGRRECAPDIVGMRQDEQPPMGEIGSSLHGVGNLSLVIATQFYLIGRYLLFLLAGRNSSDWNEWKEFAMYTASLKAFLRPPCRPKPPEDCGPRPPGNCKPRRPGYCKPRPHEKCKPKPPEYCNPEPPPKYCYMKGIERAISMKSAINY